MGPGRRGVLGAAARSPCSRRAVRSRSHAAGGPASGRHRRRGAMEVLVLDLTTGADAGRSLDLGSARRRPSAVAADDAGTLRRRLGAGLTDRTVARGRRSRSQRLMREIAADRGAVRSLEHPARRRAGPPWWSTGWGADRGRPRRRGARGGGRELRRARCSTPGPSSSAPGVVLSSTGSGPGPRIRRWPMVAGPPAVDDAGGAVAAAADPAGRWWSPSRRGLGGNRLQGHIRTNDRSARGEPSGGGPGAGRYNVPPNPGNRPGHDARP